MVVISNVRYLSGAGAGFLPTTGAVSGATTRGRDVGEREKKEKKKYMIHERRTRGRDR